MSTFDAVGLETPFNILLALYSNLNIPSNCGYHLGELIKLGFKTHNFRSLLDYGILWDLLVRLCFSLGCRFLWKQFKCPLFESIEAVSFIYLYDWYVLGLDVSLQKDNSVTLWLESCIAPENQTVFGKRWF